MLVLFLHFGGRQQQIALCREIENNFSLHQVGGHLHLWSHKSGGGEAIQFQQGEIGRQRCEQTADMNQT